MQTHVELLDKLEELFAELDWFFDNEGIIPQCREALSALSDNQLEELVRDCSELIDLSPGMLTFYNIRKRGSLKDY